MTEAVESETLVSMSLFGRVYSKVNFYCFKLHIKQREYNFRILIILTNFVLLNWLASVKIYCSVKSKNKIPCSFKSKQLFYPQIHVILYWVDDWTVVLTKVVICCVPPCQPSSPATCVTSKEMHTVWASKKRFPEEITLTLEENSSICMFNWIKVGVV